MKFQATEDLVNDYLKIIGNHEIPKGPKGDQGIWSILDPRVEFEYGSADFLTTVTFKKGKINIKKNEKKRYLSNIGLIITKLLYLLRILW